MVLSTLAQIWTWADTRDAHLAHVTFDGFAVDRERQVQHHRDAPRAQKRMGCVQLVDTMLDGQLLRRGWDRLVVQAGAIETEQYGLPRHGELRVVAFNQRPA